MKLVIAIIEDRDADAVLQAFTGRRIPVTRVATSGGFLSEGNTTLISGVDSAKVPTILDLLRKTCPRRQMFVPLAAGITDTAYGLHNQIEIEVGGATVFILDVEHFEQV